MEDKTRKFYVWEVKLVDKMLSFVPEDRERLSNQFSVSKALEQNQEGSIVEIEYPGKNFNYEDGQYPIAEGKIFDADNKQIDVLLFVDKRKNLVELELCKYEMEKIQHPLKLDSYKHINTYTE